MAAVRAPRPKKARKTRQKPPPTLKAKVGTAAMSRAERLDLSAKYLAAQPTSPVAAAMAPAATDLRTKRTSLVTAETAYTNAHLALDQAGEVLIGADSAHTVSIGSYAHAGVAAANGDPSILTSLAVETAATTRVVQEGPAEIVTGIFTLEGPTSGSAYVRWLRPAGASAFVVQYKVETPAPVPPTDWLPATGFLTKNVQWLITGLPAGATFRVRVQAVGAEVGPWSIDVLGVAR